MAGYVTGKCALFLDSGAACQEDATVRCTTCARPICTAHLRIGTMTPECSDCGASKKVKQRRAAARWKHVAEQLPHSSLPTVAVEGRSGWAIGDVEFAAKGGLLRRSREFIAPGAVLADSGPDYLVVPATGGVDAHPRDLNAVANGVEALLKRPRS